MDTDDLITKLTALGLTRNEALAWLTLLQDDGGEGLTGYEVASRSGVPRSAVYTVLRRLEGSGACFTVGSDPVKFVAIEADQWVENTRRQTLGRLAAVEEGLARLPKRRRPEPVWILSDYDEIVARIREMILGAQEALYLSLWPRELELLRDTLEYVADRKVHRVIHSPAALEPPVEGSSCWDDPDGEARGWPHRALVVVDRSEALIGGTEPGKRNHAVWSTNPSLVDVATNHIVLDITLLARASGRDAGATVSPMLPTDLPNAR